MKYSVFTVMTPDLTFERLCPLLQQLGYDGIEIRICDQPDAQDGKPSYWSGNLATVPASGVLEQIESVASLCRAHDLEMFALGTYLNPKKGLEETERMMQAARRIGCPQIRIGDGGFDPNGENYRKQLADGLKLFREVEKLARRHGVKVNLETHPNHLVVSASAHYHFVKHFDPEYVGVIYDVGNLVIEGYERWKMGLELLGEYLSFIHLKNCAVTCDGVDDNGVAAWSTDIFGRGGTMKGGMVNMAEFFKLLKQIGYDGWVSQEDFSKVLPTEQKLADNIAYLKHLEEQA